MDKMIRFPRSYTLVIAILLGYSMPLKAVKFYSYTNEKGETVYSNVPQSCISKSVMTCMDYHPVTRKAENSARSVAKPAEKPRNVRNPASATRSAVRQQQTAEEGLFGVLENISEMNAIVDQYFPGNSNPVEAAKVRERQEDILKLLEIIKKGAGEDEQSSINRAIGILKDNLVD